MSFASNNLGQKLVHPESYSRTIIMEDSEAPDFQEKVYLIIFLLPFIILLLKVLFNRPSKQEAKNNIISPPSNNNSRTKSTHQPTKRQMRVFDDGMLNDITDEELIAATDDSVLPQSTIEPIKAIATRKNYKPEAKITPSSSVSSISSITTSLSTTSSQATQSQNVNLYAINKHGKQIGSIRIHPDLTTMMTGDQTRLLKNICSSGTVLEGETKGKTGFVFLNREKDKYKYKKDGYRIKLKNPGRQGKGNQGHVHRTRFFAIPDPDGARNDFIVTGYEPTHKKNAKIISCLS